MIIGVPKEIKTREYRVGMTPAGVRSLTSRGHKVLVEKGAGEGSGIADADYVARRRDRSSRRAAEAWGAEMVVKVKEPLPRGVRLLPREPRSSTRTSTSRPSPSSRSSSREKKVTGVAYETIENDDGTLPLLRPMSEVAGPHGRAGRRERASRRSTAARACSSAACPARVAVASSSSAAASSAATRRPSPSAWARRSPCSTSAPTTMAYLEDVFGGAVETLYSNPFNIEMAVLRADLVVGAVLVTGARRRSS